jgi:sugar transferase EpsL
MWYRRFGKRAIDIVLAATALIALSPALALVALLVRVRLGPPVFFRQPRPGRGGRVFSLIKFRTMIDARDADGRQLPDSERLVPLGRFLRSTSLDELPELWNVLRGDMSLIGPRPLLVAYLPRYSPEQARRHEVRPGISGWAQVNGRNAVSWAERFRLDVWYVDQVSFMVDLRIVLKTLVVAFRREGISAQTCATMPEFTNDRASKQDLS